MSAAYDWLYDRLTPAERTDIVTKLILAAQKQRWAVSWSTTFKDYSIGGKNYCIAGLAFYGDGIDDEQAIEYVDLYVSEFQDDFIVGWNFALENGGSFQGANGHMADITYFLRVLDAFYTATDMDDLKEFSYLKYAGEWLAYSFVPHWDSGLRLFVTDNTQYGLTIDYPTMQAISRITSYSGYDSRLRSITSWLLGNRATMYPASPTVPHWTLYNYDYKLMDLIWRDADVVEQSPSVLNMPLAKHFGSIYKPEKVSGGAGIVLMRSAWEDENATFAVFKCASFKYTHDDYDSNSFIINKKGRLAIDSGLYENGDWWSHEVNYAYRTIAHNSMLIWDTNEVFDKGCNDGGQRVIQYVYDRQYPDEYYAGAGRDIGGITKFKSVAGKYDYMKGDATRAYQSALITDAGESAKISLFTRDFVYLRSSDSNNDFFVVFDKVNSTDSTFEKQWLLHSVSTPTINGSFTAGGTDDSGGTNAYGGTPGSISSDSDLVTITDEDGKLFSKTLLPASCTVTKVGGPNEFGVINSSAPNPSYESYVNGTNYRTDTDKGSFYDFRTAQGSWRIEVQPAVEAEEDLFLHVLHPCDIAVSSMTTTIKIESSGSEAVGTHIAVNGAYDGWCVMFSTTTTELDDITYTINDTGNVRNLICDLKPNTRFNVLKGGVFETSAFTPAEGTLYFEDEIAGEVTYQILENPHMPEVQSIIGR